MRQFIAEISVNPGPGNSTQQRYGNSCGTGTYLCEKRPGTGAGKCPAQAENQPTINLSFIKFLVMEYDFLSVDCFCPEFFNQKNRSHGHKDCRADDSVHMEGLQPEHLLNTEPADHFSFNKNNAEENSYKQII